MNEIRKISVGPNYKEAMHYIVGQNVLSDNYTITLIKATALGYDIFIKDNSITDEVVLWKSFENMPISVEYNINF